MITFKKTPNKYNSYDHETIDISTESTDRNDLLECFHSFMTACGYTMSDIQEAIENYDPYEEHEMDKYEETGGHDDMVEKLNKYNHLK